MWRGIPTLAAGVATLAGCGSHAVSTHPFPTDPQIWARAATPAEQRSLTVLSGDVQRLRAAAAAAPSRTLMGTPALRRTTNRFLLDLQRSPVDNLSKNRIIDHAATAAASGCDQCFQQLEAVRPIPAISEGGNQH